MPIAARAPLFQSTAADDELSYMARFKLAAARPARKLPEARHDEIVADLRESMHVIEPGPLPSILPPTTVEPEPEPEPITQHWDELRIRGGSESWLQWIDETIAAMESAAEHPACPPPEPPPKPVRPYPPNPARQLPYYGGEGGTSDPAIDWDPLFENIAEGLKHGKNIRKLASRWWHSLSPVKRRSLTFEPESMNPCARLDSRTRETAVVMEGRRGRFGVDDWRELESELWIYAQKQCLYSSTEPYAWVALKNYTCDRFTESKRRSDIADFMTITDLFGDKEEEIRGEHLAIADRSEMQLSDDDHGGFTAEILLEKAIVGRAAGNKVYHRWSTLDAEYSEANRKEPLVMLSQDPVPKETARIKRRTPEEATESALLIEALMSYGDREKRKIFNAITILRKFPGKQPFTPLYSIKGGLPQGATMKYTESFELTMTPKMRQSLDKLSEEHGTTITQIIRAGILQLHKTNRDRKGGWLEVEKAISDSVYQDGIGAVRWEYANGDPVES